MVLTQAAVALMQFADTAMVAGLGTAELAAITPAGLSVLVAVTFGTGALSIVTAMVGQTQEPRSRLHLGWQGVWIACVLGLGLQLLVPTAPTLFQLFGHPPEIRALEVQYFTVCMGAVIPQCIIAAVANYFLGCMRPVAAMVGTTLAVAANLFFNYVLIYGALGFPELGFIGAAWGTFIASILASAVVMAVLIYEHRSMSAPAEIAKPQRRSFRTLLGKGMPIGIQDTVETMSWGIVVVVLVGRFGEAHLAATSVLIRCMQLSFLPADGVGTGVMSLVANSIGVGKFRQAEAQADTAFRVNATYMTGMAILFLVFREPIMRAFSNDPEVIEIGTKAMLCVCLFQMFDALNITYMHALIGAGDSSWPSLANALLGIVILLGGGVLVTTQIPQLGSFGVWIVTTLYVIAQGTVIFLRWKFGPWRQQLANSSP